MYKKLCNLASFILVASFLLLTIPAGVMADNAPIDTGIIKGAILMEPYSGRVLFEHDSSSKYSVAGLTRLAALLIICEAFDSGTITDDTVVTVSAKSAAVKGTTAFLANGERMNAGDMLMAAVMINAGDAIHALMCCICGSENTAVERINARCRELGIDASYSDICGDGVLLSCTDLAAIGTALIKSESFRRNSSLYYEKLSHTTGASQTELANPNKLTKQYSGCLGVATGSSTDAGYCGVFASERGGTTYIAVAIGAKNSSDRFVTGIELMDYGYANFRSSKMVTAGETAAEIPVSGALEKTIKLVTASDLSLLVSVNGAKLYSETEIPESVEAPIKEGQIIGRIRYLTENGEIVGEVDLIAYSGAEKAGFKDYVMLIMRAWFGRT